MDTLQLSDPDFRSTFVNDYLFRRPCKIVSPQRLWDHTPAQLLDLLAQLEQQGTADERAAHRLYVDGKLLPQVGADMLPLPGHTMGDHLARITGQGQSEVCHLLSHVQAFLPEFARQAQPLIASFSSAVDCDLLVLDSALFIGQYGSTPLRVHKDNACTFKFIVSGSKTLLAWPLSYFKPGRTVGERESFLLPPLDYRDHLEAATVVPAEAGDIVYFPFHMWHVLTSDGRPHCSLSLSFTPATRGSRLTARDFRYVSTQWAGLPRRAMQSAE